MKLNREKIIARARNDYGSDDIDIVDAAELQKAEHGTWVAAWVWMSDVYEDEDNT